MAAPSSPKAGRSLRPRGGRATANAVAKITANATTRAAAPSQLRTRRIGNLSLLLPPPRPPATAIAACLERLQRDWQRQGHLAALWQAWPRIAGPQLAPHCRPLQLHAGMLTVGAPPGPWLQALQYNRHQLLGNLRGAGFVVRDLRLQQHYPEPPIGAGLQAEAEVWAVHPSRIDVHGLTECPACNRPAPAGELARWGHCSFCLRAQGPEGVRG